MSASRYTPHDGGRDVNSRDRVSSALDGSPVTPVPYHLHLLADLIRELHARRGPGDVDELLGNDIRWMSLPARKERLADGSWRDEWGVRWSADARDRGSVLEHPLGSASLDGLKVPPPPSQEDVAALGRECSAHRDRYRVVWIGDLLERAQFLRSMEEILVDLALHEDFACELLDRIADSIVERVRAIAGLDFEAVFLSDDYGSQHGLLMSPGMWRRTVRPRVERVFAAARAAGKRIFLHSCGRVDEIVGDLVEMGLDALHPVQPEAVDLPRLVSEFGGKLAFFGGVSTQRTMCSASPRDVAREVRMVCDLCARGGRFILAPGISLQRDVPWENVEAFIAAAGEWR